MHNVRQRLRVAAQDKARPKVFVIDARETAYEIVENDRQGKGNGDFRNQDEIVCAVQFCAFVQRFGLLAEEGLEQEHTRNLCAADHRK